MAAAVTRRPTEPEWPIANQPESETLSQATLAAIDLVISRQLDAFQRAEAELANLSRNIDPSARLACANQLEAETLSQAYHKALE